MILVVLSALLGLSQGLVPGFGRNARWNHHGLGPRAFGFYPAQAPHAGHPFALHRLSHPYHLHHSVLAHHAASVYDAPFAHETSLPLADAAFTADPVIAGSYDAAPAVVAASYDAAPAVVPAAFDAVPAVAPVSYDAVPAVIPASYDAAPA